MSIKEREIPYNYTSLSDKKITIRLLDIQAWDILEELRCERKTGRSAKMLFEILGDMWVVYRNLYIQEDLIHNKKRTKALIVALKHRLKQITLRVDGNTLVLKLIKKTEQAIDKFANFLHQQTKYQQNIKKQLSKITSDNSIRFDPLSRSSHSTDATDWRVEYPVCVLTPSTELEISELVLACIELGLTVIPRGGGTGYTGGVIPLTKTAVVINTEKLLNISSVEKVNGINRVSVGAGVITKCISELATRNNLIFAVDPTSQDACTIGGNVAMNAGGKKALRYGTTIDNLLDWTMFLPNGQWLKVSRVNHNLQKMHLLEEVEFALDYFKNDKKTLIKTEKIVIKGSEVRQEGLGKDVTNKFLAGLPGVQKEGCDGIITSASFVLHEVEKFKETICLEFFGADLHKAVPAIVKITDFIAQVDGVELIGLEHLDSRYIKAVNYSTKANRPELPKMVLIGDISSNNQSALNDTCNDIIKLVQGLEGEGFIAKNDKERAVFWKDRANTAAIAAHTNAFKINEDVVIPLNKLADYSDGIERINIRLSIQNKLETITAVKQHLKKFQSENTLQIEKIKLAVAYLEDIEQDWQNILDNLEKNFRDFQTQELVISYKNTIAKRFNELFIGASCENLCDVVKNIHAEFKKNRLFIATHMHAGDGNVHTNIPVHSHNQEMLKLAEGVVDEIMILATSLGGSISGEHGIGLTKFQYLPQLQKDEFAQYKNKIDPKGHFNKNKLLSGADLSQAYTPSLQLVEQEALIMENSQIGEINHMVKDCLRCGKCKPVCSTHVPEANLLYSPRDKIIGTNLLIEAFLYEEQTRRGISLQHMAELEDISDHCTICHRCEKPCPVDIDYGEVSIKMRELLIAKNNKNTNIATKFSYSYLNATHPFKIKVIKKLLDLGYLAQRLGAKITHHKTKIPNVSIGKPSFPVQVETILNRPLPKDTTTNTMRALLKIESSSHIPVLAHPLKSNEDSEAIFYFPGCGSERLFSQISLSALALLYDMGVKIVLPPGYLCCGYPQNASGNIEKATQISTQNRVLFHRIANTLNYLEIKTVLTSCGTCIDQLLTYQFGDIFTNSRLIDIHEYLLEKQVKLENTQGKYLYHAPCHDPIKSSVGSETIINELMGNEVVNNDRCCAEAGTFAVSRPDIAKQVSFRKEAEIHKDLKILINKEVATKTDNIQMLTTCPACRQGLSRYENTTGVSSIYPIEILAKEKLGDNWLNDFVKNVNVEEVLL